MAVTAPDDLLVQIREKRAQLSAYIARLAPKKARLLNTTIVAGSLAAALTAAPAIGGQTFTAWLTRTFGLDAPAWQLLCGAAAMASVASTVSTQLLKSHNIEEHLAKAQSCRAKLEVLEVGLTTGRLDPSDATLEYLHCVEDVAFIDIG